jgi:hypothetical protein
LKLWNLETPSTPEKCDSLNLDLKEIFIDYNLKVQEISEDTILIEAELTPYLGFITTKLSFEVVKDKYNCFHTNFLSNVKKEDRKIRYDDSVLVDIEGEEISDNKLTEAIDQRLYFYRTLAMPPLFRAPVSSDSMETRLYFHGRDIDSLLYHSLKNWTNSMYHLSSNMMVYAGIMDLNVADETADLRIFLIFTKEKAKGHHFFIIKEKYGGISSLPQLTEIKVDFYPYIRMDNIVSLFGIYATDKNSIPPQIKAFR